MAKDYQQAVSGMIEIVKQLVVCQVAPDAVNEHTLSISYNGIKCQLDDQPAVVEGVLSMLEQLVIDYPTYYC